ncbi:MAG TPA: protein kinase [Verrucomicrobiae bacterium]|nr:protein kinase [Verrucomicrobiae bacterium]
MLRLALDKPEVPPEDSPSLPPQTPSNPGSDPGRALLNGESDSIPGYHLVHEIGHGGCGIVYLAEQERPVRRRVALKVIKIGMDTRLVVARFNAERQLLARMDHPNIAKVLDAGATEKGKPYFAMELVDGHKITQFCDENGLGTADRIRLFVQVCRAIQHAHQKGIIHRDIKPSNVLVAQHDGIAVPKVIDFGIAKATQGNSIGQTVFTAFEQFLGTPMYMSPEQAQPGGVDVDTRSDIYSLGVLLYELLTGVPPFELDGPNASRGDSVRRTVLGKQALRPSTRLNMMSREQLANLAHARRTDTLKLLKVIRGDLDWIVMKCLEQERARRYETANGLARDLERYLASEPVVARPPSAAYRFRKFVARNRLATASALAISGILMAGTIISSWLAIKATRAEREQRALRLQAQNAKQHATDELWASCLAQARARRLTREAGAGFESLAVIAKAAAIRPALELRNEAIASLAQADIRWQQTKSFKTHTKVLTEPTLAFYASRDNFGTVRVSRFSDDKELARIPEADAPVTGIWLFRTDPPLLALSYKDGRTRIWNWQKRVCLLQMASPFSLDFSADGAQLAISSGDRIDFLNLNPQAASMPSPRVGSDVDPGGWSLKFSPDSRFVAGYNEAHTNILIIDAVTGEISRKLPHQDGVHRIAWGSKGRYLASSCIDNYIHLWDVEASGEFQRLPGNQGVGLAFNPDDTLLAVSGWDGRTRLWDFLNARQLVSVYKSGELVGFSPDGAHLTEISWEGHRIDSFDIANPKVLRTLKSRDSDPRGPAGNAVFSQNGALVAFSCPDGVRVWEMRGDQQIGFVDGEQTALIGFDPDDQHLIVADEQGLALFPLVSGARPNVDARRGSSIVLDLEHPVRPVVNLVGRAGCVSRNGEYCCFVGSNRCEIVNLKKFDEPVMADFHPGARFLAASPDASWVATGAWLSPQVMVWDGRTGKKLKTLDTPDTTSVIFSPEGKYLVTGSADHYTFWQTGSWVESFSIPQHEQNDFVPSMAFSGDGRIFAGTHSRRIVRLYDVATREVLADLEPPDPHTVTGVCLNDDGSYLAVCEGYQSQRVWDLKAIRAGLEPLGLDWKLRGEDAHHRH